MNERIVTPSADLPSDDRPGVEVVGDGPGLIGVVAPGRQRRELFRVTIDITPGRLPRRQPRFAFLDRGPGDD